MVVYFWNSNIEGGDQWVLRVHQPTIVAKIVSFQFSQRPCLKAIWQGAIEEDTQCPVLDSISTHVEIAHIYACTHALAWAHTLTCIHMQYTHTHTQYKPRCWEIGPHYEMMWLPWQMSVPSMMLPRDMAASLCGVWATELETRPHKYDYTNILAAFLLPPTCPLADKQAPWFLQ